jgi:hypothetical protein
LISGAASNNSTVYTDGGQQLSYNTSTNVLTAGSFDGSGASLTALNASNLGSGTVPTARLGSGTASSSNFLRGDNSWQSIDLTNLSANSLTSGTIPDARFPSTLPAASGANLTNVNATTLDSIDSGSFLRSDADDSFSGKLTSTYSSNEKIILSGSVSPYITFQEGNNTKAYIQWNSAGYLDLQNAEDGSRIRIKDDPVFSSDGSNFYTIWHAGNDGAGSGLDADTLDGVSSGSFLRGDAADTAHSDITFDGGAGAITMGSGADIRLTNGTWTGESPGKIQHHDNRLYLQGGTNGFQFRSHNGASTGTWTLDNSGNFYPSTNGTINLGTSSYRVGNVHAANFHGDGSNLTNLPASAPSFTTLFKYQDCC